MTTSTPDYQVIALMDDWTKRYPPEDSFIAWFREDAIQIVANIAGENVTTEVSYDNPHAFSGLHRPYVLAIVQTNNEVAHNMASSITTPVHARKVIIK